ncbi:hypothetical protein AC1031_004137 [Aphanomyces cochlioides]|nr:hypothetical protein AC1031_004137 [Aphanomyces cochlioides]
MDNSTSGSAIESPKVLLKDLCLCGFTSGTKAVSLQGGRLLTLRYQDGGHSDYAVHGEVSSFQWGGDSCRNRFAPSFLPVDHCAIAPYANNGDMPPPTPSISIIIWDMPPRQLDR